MAFTFPSLASHDAVFSAGEKNLFNYFLNYLFLHLLIASLGVLICSALTREIVSSFCLFLQLSVKIGKGN